MRKHCVYLLYGRRRLSLWLRRELLYIGYTNNIKRRLSEHGRDKVWFNQVVKVKVKKCWSRKGGLKLERKLIRKLNPRYNRC